MIAALALAGSASAFANATATVKTTYFTTYCPAPTTFTYGASTYTVTQATTLTIEDCGCTESAKATAVPKNSTAPALVNGAVAGKVGAAAGVAAAVAYLL